MSETPSTNYSVVQHHTSGSEQSFSARPLNVTEPVVAKRVCFYKSGDPQFNGVKMVVNNRSFKSFDALLDNLSKRVPLPFGVRNITTPRGIHSINNLEELEDGKSYICSQQRKVKPINLEMASKKPLPWQNSRPISARRRAVQLAREGDRGIFQRGSTIKLSTPKKLLVFKNGNVRIRRAVVLGKKSTENFEAFLEHISELMQYPVMKLYTTDGRKVPNLQALVLCSGAVVAAGKEPFKAGNYDPHRYSLPGKLPGATNRVYPRSNAKSENRKMSAQIDSSSRSQMFSASSSKGYSNDNNSVSSYVPDNDMALVGNSSQTGEEFCLVPPADDIEKSVHLNQDGSMTVEMKVRFNIKEEETIKWTTCVSRAGTSAMTTEDQLSELNILTYKNTDEDSSHAEDDVSLQQISTEMTNQNSVGIMESSTYDIWQNPSMNSDLNQTDNNNAKPRFYRPPTPGPRRVRQKKALVESVTVVSDKAVQKKLVGQFSYSEEMDSGETKSEYCMVTHASSQTSSVTNSNPLPNQNVATGSNPDFFNAHSEWSCSNNEDIICNQCKELLASQASQHLSPPETNETVCKCVQPSSAVMQPSHITGTNDSAEGMTATQFSDGSQAVSISSKTKKNKKKKKSAHIMKKAIGSHENLNDVSMERNDVQTTEIHTARESTQHSSTKVTTKKIVLAFPVGNSHNSNKNVITEDGLYSEDPLQSQPNELLFKIKKNPNRQLPKLKVKSDKKHNLPQTTKAEGLLLVKHNSKNDTEHVQEVKHDSIYVTDQTSTDLASLKPKIDQESNLNVETEHAKTTSNQIHKLSMKHKKAKKNKKIESAQASEVEGDRALAALRHRDFTDEITEHSLENYVQSWLQNIFPDTVRPDQCLAPISSNERKNKQLSVKSFPGKGSELAGNNSIIKGKESNHLSEMETVEESVQELKNIYEKHIGCLTDSDVSLIEEAKYLLQSNIQNNRKLSLCNIIHENEKKKIPTEDDGQRHMSAIAAHIHTHTNNNLLGTDVAEDYMRSALLHELKSAILNAEKNNTGCIKKSCCHTDNSLSSLLGSPSNLLLAWLLLLNLKESLSNVNKDDIMQTTCRCSEIFTLLKYLKQVAVKEKADDLENAVSNMQDCTANYLILSAKQTERQEPVHCEDKISLVNIKNTSDAKEQDDLNNSEAEDLNKRISEEQSKGSLVVENSNLHDFLNANGPVSLNNPDLISNEKSLKENEDNSLQESQEKHTDASYNNEESEISEEPKSTTHSITSHDKDHFFEIETSEIDEKELKSTEEQECMESLCKTENRNESLTSAAENATNGDKLEDSTHEDLEEEGTCEESSDRVSQPSPLSFCYESKQIPADACEEEPTSRVKLIVKELECGGFHSSSSMEFKKCLKSPATSDLSDYRPESDESDYNFRQSSDLTNGSADEALYEKEYNKGYVKRTIERLYGKTEASSKPGPPYLAQVLQKDTEESFHTVMEKGPSFSEAHNTWSNDDMSSSVVSHEIPQDLYTTNSAWEKENATLPSPQFSLNGEEAYYNDDYVNQCNKSSGLSAEDGGVLIEKGKWLLKEDHLLRRSPPENNGMYGTTDTSADTAFDNHSDDIPYSHFGNLDSQPPLKEISSSELEDMIKPCDNGCNYFNMPHNSDSEPFPDSLSVKSQNSQIGSTLPLKATRKVYTNSTEISADVNTSPPAFTSVEFRLPDNKVHPTDQPLNDEPVQTQPNRNGNSNRNSREDQDSLDKLHAICGQHCPILMAIIRPTNETIRGCAYQKASDIENQVGLHLFTHSPLVMWQGKHAIGFDKNQAQLKNNCINKIAHKIFDRFYADNTLDFMNDDNFRLLLSLKENPGLNKLSITESMAVNLQEINNHENYAVEEASSERTVGQNNNLSVSHSSRGNINQIPPSFPEAVEDCGCETFHHQETFLSKTDGKLTVNFEEENALNVKDETLSSVTEKKSGTESSDS